VDNDEIKLLELNADTPTMIPANINAESHHSMLFTSLGYPEDVANLQPLMQAAEKAGFDVVYADLPDVPPYSLIYQSKLFLALLSENYPDHKHLLFTSSDRALFEGKKHVEKVTFGRLGQNIKVVDGNGGVIEKTDGEYGHHAKLYQEFVELYKDEDDDLYQPSVFMVDGRPSCLSFRRGEKLIIDDDAQFIPHIIT